MHTATGQRVQIGRQRRGEGLAFTRLHLGDAVGVQHHAADQLHVEVTHAEHPAGGLTYGGERFRQQLLKRLALLQALTVLGGLRLQLAIGQGLELRLHRIDLFNNFAQSLERSVVPAADNLGEQCANHVYQLFWLYKRSVTGT